MPGEDTLVEALRSKAATADEEVEDSPTQAMIRRLEGLLIPQGELASQKTMVLLTQEGLRVLDRVARRIYLVKPGRQDLPAGIYYLDVTEALGGLRFSTKEFKIERGATVALRVTRTLERTSAERVGLLRRVAAQPESIHQMALSPDGKLVATTTGGVTDEQGKWTQAIDFDPRVWDVATGRLVQRFAGHTSSSFGVCFSADGKRLLTSGDLDLTLRLWDVGTGTEVQAFEGHSSRVRGVALSHDGQFALSADGDGSIRLWATATGKEVRRYEGHTSMVHAVAFTPHGRRLFSAGNDKTVRRWDRQTGQETLRFEGHTAEVTCVAVAPNGRRVLSGDGSGNVLLWDADTGKELRRFAGNPGFGQAVAFAPDGHRILTAGPDHTVLLYDITTGKELCRLHGHTLGITGVAFLPDGLHALSSSLDRTICLWRLPASPAPHPQGRPRTPQ